MHLHTHQLIAAVVGAALWIAAAPAHAADDAGALLFSVRNQAVRYDLAKRRAATMPLSRQSTEMLGFGGGVATDVEVDKRISAAPDRYTVKLLRATGSGFSGASALPPFAVSTGHVSGPVQPSRSASRFAMHTIERAGLGEPQTDYVYVFNDRGKATMRARGLRDPAWLDDDRLVAAGEDGLFIVTVAGGGTARIGPRGLGRPGAEPRRPAVSPDGRSVAFAQGDAVWRINLDGSGLVRLTQPRPGQSWPTWSPDGSHVAVVRRSCPPVGGASPPPEFVIVSAGARDQDIERLPQVKQTDGVPVRACGPIYWVR
jgi:hypothetical protein